MNKKIIFCNSGGVIILIAAIIPLLLIVMAVTIETGRLYVAQAKAQHAADSALRGAVATFNANINLANETQNLFFANFPAGYMGTNVAKSDIVVMVVPPGTYSVTIPITVPSMFSSVMGSTGYKFTIFSQVITGYQSSPTQYLELALVLDNTGSMADIIDSTGTTKISALKTASDNLVNDLFGTAASLNNLHISIVPFDTDVNVGSSRTGWVQAAYTNYFNGKAFNPKVNFGSSGFLANRNSDILPTNQYNDLTDAAPLTDATRFRVPPYIYPNEPINYTIGGTNYNDGYPDFIDSALAPMAFSLDDKQTILNEIKLMAPSGNTRINVGLMWGWFTLSSKWQGVWDSGKPGFPATPAPNITKQLVLMTDGQNTVWTSAYGGKTSDDDQTTGYLCEAMKAQGITIYTIGLGAPGDYNQALLQKCASQSTFFFAVPSAAMLTEVFHQIADNLIYDTLHTSQ